MPEPLLRDAGEGLRVCGRDAGWLLPCCWVLVLLPPWSANPPGPSETDPFSLPGASGDSVPAFSAPAPAVSGVLWLPCWTSAAPGASTVSPAVGVSTAAVGACTAAGVDGAEVDANAVPTPAALTTARPTPTTASFSLFFIEFPCL